MYVQFAVFGVTTKVRFGPVAAERSQCASKTFYETDAKSLEIAYFAFVFLTTFLAPFFAIVGSYGLILIVLRRKTTSGLGINGQLHTNRPAANEVQQGPNAPSNKPSKYIRHHSNKSAAVEAQFGWYVCVLMKCGRRLTAQVERISEMRTDLN